MKYLQKIGDYEYFRREVGGRTIRHRMPARDDPAFAVKYQQLLSGREPDAPVPGSMKELVAVYRMTPKYRNLSPRSKVTRDFYLGLILDQHGDKAYGEFTRGVALRERDKLADTPGKANNLIATFALLFQCAVDREMLKANPCLRIEKLKIGEHRPWTDKELTDAFEAASPLTRLALALHLYTGQRIGDVCLMEWKNVKDGLIEVRQQKTGKMVWIPIHPVLKTELERVPRHVRWLLYNAQGNQMKVAALEDRIGVLRHRLGVEGIRWHGLRKNVVNNLLEVGCSTAEVAAITGQSLQTIEHYAKGRDGKTLARNAMKKWEGKNGR